MQQHRHNRVGSVIRGAIRGAVVMGLMGGVGPIAAFGQTQDAAPPDETVMRPTKSGFRVSPELARLAMKRWIQMDLSRDVTLTEGQESELNRRLAENLMETLNRRGKGVRELAEFGIESFLSSGGPKWSSDRNQQFAEKAADLMPLVSDFVKQLAADARPLLTNYQWDQLKDRLVDDFRNIKRMNDVLDRWQKGDVEPGADLLRELADPMAGADPAEANDPKQRERRRNERLLRRAKRRAEATLRELSPSHWAVFIDNCKKFFAFNDEQMDKARALLVDYTKKADDFMIPYWRERVRANRIKYDLRWSLKDEPAKPWIYHLEREYNELIAPVHELETAFQKEVMALATPKQREEALARFQEEAEAHGIGFDSLDAEVLSMEP